MQAISHNNPPLLTLLRLTAKARETFERFRYHSTPMHYRVERCDGAGEYRWKVVIPGSARAVALRRTRSEALEACDTLEGRG